MNRPKICVLLLGVTLVACQPQEAQPPLAGARIGGPFALTDQDGRPRTDRDFTGRYRIMYFGYSYCPDVCPTDVAHVIAGYRAFVHSHPAASARLVPLFVTVDPLRDTPPVLKQFVSAFDPALVGLTGTPEQIASVTKSYGVSYAVQAPRGNVGYLVDHSRVAYLMDPAGRPLMILSHDAKADVIADELARWVR